MKQCFVAGQSFKGEIMAYTKGGEPRWFDVKGQPLFDEEGKIQRFFIIQTDITKRKKESEQIRKLSTYIQKSKDLIVVVNPDCSINWVNESFEKTTGYSLQEVSGKKCHEILQGPETDAQTSDYINECMLKGDPFQAEILNYPKTGEPYWLEINGQPFYDENGRVMEYFTIQRNITERKRLEKQLADEVNQRQKAVTSAVIKTQERERAEVGRELHDNVNQVLTSVKLYQELVLSGIGNRDELVKKSIDLLMEAINENRSLSKRLSAPTLGNIKLMESVKDLVETVAATRKFELTLQTDAINDLEVNEELHLAVYRILQEHLTNVSKYAAATKVHVNFNRSNDVLFMEITDNGRGFEPSLKRNGIGITNMMMRAEHLNGMLTIDSAPGKGCTMTAQFPLT